MNNNNKQSEGPSSAVDKSIIVLDSSDDDDDDFDDELIVLPPVVGSAKKQSSAVSEQLRSNLQTSLSKENNGVTIKSTDVRRSPSRPPQSKAVPTKRKSSTLLDKSRKPPAKFDWSSDGCDSQSDDSLLNAPTYFKAKRKVSPSAKTVTKQAPLEEKSQPKVLQSQSSTSTTSKKPPARKQPSQNALRKETEKALRQQQREQQKQDRQLLRQAEKDAKKRHRMMAQQRRGNFCHEEIVALVDPPLYRKEEWEDNDEHTTYKCRLHEYTSALGGGCSHAVQWIRLDFMEGGADKAIENLLDQNQGGYEHMNRLAMVFDNPKDFIQLLYRDDEQTTTVDGPVDLDDDYPQLRIWFLALQEGWKAAWECHKSSRPRIVVILHRVLQELDKMWVAYRKLTDAQRRRQATPPSAAEFHDALSWMLLEFQVECVICDSMEEVWTALLKMTRALCKKGYQLPVTDLDTVKRFRSSTKTATEESTILDMAKDTWLRQLQLVHGVSEAKARSFIRYYPTSQSLWRAYQDESLSASDKRDLVADCFSDTRRCAGLSSTLYRLMTSTNTEEIP